MPKGDKRPVVMGDGIVNDLSTGGANSALSAEMGKVLGIRPNPQMLHNWSFENAVNQRGNSVYETGAAWLWAADRWRLYGAVMTVGSRFFNLSFPALARYKRMTQLTEHTLRAGQTYTLSLLAKINTVSGGAILRPVTSSYGAISTTSGSSGITINKTTSAPEMFSYTFTPVEDVNSAGVELFAINSADNSLDADIYAVKLEKGSVQTLASRSSSGEWVLNDVQNYGEELLKCQRYQMVYPVSNYSQHWIAAAQSDTRAKVSVTLPVNPASSPVIDFDTETIALTDGSSIYPITAAERYATSGNVVTLDLTSSGLTAGKAYMLRASGTAKIIFDANL